MQITKPLPGRRMEVVFHFDHGLSSAITEAFNETAKLAQRRANGHKNFKNARLRILSDFS